MFCSNAICTPYCVADSECRAPEGESVCKPLPSSDVKALSLGACTSSARRSPVFRSDPLRTPLTAILGWANMLRIRPMKPATTAHALSVLERNARALAQLVDSKFDEE